MDLDDAIALEDDDDKINEEYHRRVLLCAAILGHGILESRQSIPVPTDTTSVDLFFFLTHEAALPGSDSMPAAMTRHFGNPLIQGPQVQQPMSRP